MSWSKEAGARRAPWAGARGAVTTARAGLKGAERGDRDFCEHSHKMGHRA